MDWDEVSRWEQALVTALANERTGARRSRPAAFEAAVAAVPPALAWPAPIDDTVRVWRDAWLRLGPMDGRDRPLPRGAGARLVGDVPGKRTGRRDARRGGRAGGAASGSRPRVRRTGCSPRSRAAEAGHPTCGPAAAAPRRPCSMVAAPRLKHRTRADTGHWSGTGHRTPDPSRSPYPLMIVAMTSRVAVFVLLVLAGQCPPSSCRPAPRSGPNHPARSSRARRSGSTRFRTASTTRSAPGAMSVGCNATDHRQRRRRAGRRLAHHAGRRLGARRAAEDDHRQADALRRSTPTSTGITRTATRSTGRTWRSSVTSSRARMLAAGESMRGRSWDMFIGGVPAQIAQLAQADRRPRPTARPRTSCASSCASQEQYRQALAERQADSRRRSR